MHADCNPVKFLLIKGISRMQSNESKVLWPTAWNSPGGQGMVAQVLCILRVPFVAFCNSALGGGGAKATEQGLTCVCVFYGCV
jgi:hypothetical protein